MNVLFVFTSGGDQREKANLVEIDIFLVSADQFFGCAPVCIDQPVIDTR